MSGELLALIVFILLMVALVLWLVGRAFRSMARQAKQDIEDLKRQAP